jgi:hypothetical protein
MALIKLKAHNPSGTLYINPSQVGSMFLRKLIFIVIKLCAPLNQSYRKMPRANGSSTNKTVCNMYDPIFKT